MNQPQSIQSNLPGLPQLTPHEALELHEIVTSEIIAVKKLQASLALVKDQDLKQIMEQTLALKKATLSRYQDFYSNSVKQ